MATTAVGIADVTRELEAKNAELSQLQQRLSAAQRTVAELTATRRELELALANDAPGAADRLRNLLVELEVAAGRASGIEQLAAALQPELERLRQAWDELRRAEVRAARAAEVDRLAGEISALDTEILSHQAAIGDLSEQRRGLFERRLALMKG